MPVYEDIKQESQLRQAIEPYRNEVSFTLQGVIPNGVGKNPGLASLLLVPPGGNLKIKGISGRALGPVDATGLRLDGGATSFPAAGTTTGQAEKGLWVHIVDVSGAGRDLSAPKQQLNPPAAGALIDFVPIEALLSPGYASSPFFRLLPFLYMVEKNNFLRFDFKNYDTGAGAAPIFHKVSINIFGERYIS